MSKTTIVETDFTLLKQENYEKLLKKYLPLIRRLSYSCYKSNPRDNSVSYEDVCQINTIRTWRFIEHTKNKMEKDNFDEGMRFGVLLKMYLKAYNKAYSEKKRNTINFNLVSIDEEMKPPKDQVDKNTKFQKYIAYNDKFAILTESTIIFEKFVSQLSEREKTFVDAYKVSDHLSEVAKKMNIPYNIGLEIRKRLKLKYIEFLYKEGLSVSEYALN